MKEQGYKGLELGISLPSGGLSTGKTSLLGSGKIVPLEIGLVKNRML